MRERENLNGWVRPVSLHITYGSYDSQQFHLVWVVSEGLLREFGEI